MSNAVPKPEFPLPQRIRKHWLNLNGRWDFSLFPEGCELDESTRTYDQHITVPFSWTCPLSGVERDEKGVGWYRRSASFSAPDQRIFLCFGAVDYIADVYVNGSLVCHHQGGYTYFDCDVTDVWSETNVIEVRAEDFRRETQSYGKQGYGDIQGIWQTVWLEARPTNYINNYRSVTRIDGSVDISANIFMAAAGEVTLSCAFDETVGKTAAKLPAGFCDIALTLEFDSPRLWSPNDPYLYEGSIALNEDVIETYIGIREISVVHDEYPRIAINGKPVYINGTLDQAFNPTGYFTYPDEESISDEAFRLRRLGLNMARIHVKLEEPRKLYHMDKAGILIMQDMPNFWGEPNDEARSAYESEWPDAFNRDINHPSIFSWVMFNETWGLNTKVDGKNTYLPETQEWVRSVYKRAKAFDPTRLVEDNSACMYDHVETDINSWHFYLNGYDTVKDHMDNIDNNIFVGSPFNYIGGNQQGNAPLMNSECGMVWGVDGSAGDSDIAWQYRYMLNQFRLPDKLCGFIFTEFHDVVNEFNGYYRIFDADKDFGYQDFCRGMRIADLHAQDFIAVDCPPCVTVNAGDCVTVPIKLSSFTGRSDLCITYELWYDGMDGRVGVMSGCAPQHSTAIAITMPHENALAVLSLYLTDKSGAVISRNFTTFDVRSECDNNIIAQPVALFADSSFEKTASALSTHKLSCFGAGVLTYDMTIPKGDIADIEVVFEAGAKRTLTKDCDQIYQSDTGMDFMRGYKVDRGAFKNSYFMTDEEEYPSIIDIFIDGIKIKTLRLGNDYADARGVLSWHYQTNNRVLDDAGSYGELIKVCIPSRLIPGIMSRGSFALTIKADNGLALYGRNAGRYAVDLMTRVTRMSR